MESILSKINKVKIAGAMIVAIPSFCLVGYIAKNIDFSTKIVAQALTADTYEVTLNSSRKITTSSTSGIHSNTFYTANGNEYIINGDKIRNTGDHFVSLDANGYITLLKPLNGLKSITVTASNGANITVGYGWNAGVQNPYAKANFTGSFTYNFDNRGPSYFSILNSGANMFSIDSIVCRYSCVATPVPEDVTEAYLVDGRTVKNAIGSLATKVTFCSLNEAKADGATNANVNLTAKGDTKISLYKKGNEYYIAADAEKPTFVFNQDSSYMFDNVNTLTQLVLTSSTHIDTSKVVNFESMFFQMVHIDENSLNSFLTNFDTSSGRNFASMFNGLNMTKHIDISHFEFTNKQGVDLQRMFFNCTSLEEVKFSNVKMSKLTWDFHQYENGPLSSMFGECHSLKSIDLSSFNLSSPNDGICMFARCYELETIYVDGAQGVDFSRTASWATGWNGMFADCYKLVGQNGTTWSYNADSATYARVDRNGQPGYFTSK